MPRRCRIESRSNYYHIMVRGNNKEWVFKENKDKDIYYHLLRKCVEENDISITAWCIMNNHAHILMKGDIANVSESVKKVNTSFAMKYNTDYERIGHVFQDRFKSEVVENRKYFCGLIRYIHCNPIKANIAESLSGYKWSSYNEYFIRPRLVDQNSIHVVIKYFNDINHFKEFHKANDINEYLDTKEDVNRKRHEIANIIITKYCDVNGIAVDKVKSFYFEDLVEELLKKTNIPTQDIAKALNVSNRKVIYVKSKIYREKNI